MKPRDGTIDPMLETALPDTAAASIAVASRAAVSHGAPAGYTLGELLGRGGMGEVMLASDERIGRDVAIKRMRSADPSPELVERFLREAKIQARLDHPAIVPVHEVGHDAEGRPYFTMKRLTGVTLHDLLVQNKLTDQKLLRAFGDVCLAIQFAHERGVIHRDLKPSNLMLGDYGDVYVLDWGIARVLGEKPGADRAAHVGSFDGETVAGTLLGTPGYMSPEQSRGDEVTTATDVYALGAILFEILTREPLHARGAAFESTRSGPQSPADRTPARSIAPELDAACLDALADDAAARPSARELADRVQRYLDGDRDVERRRTLAEDHLAVARAALASNDSNQRGDAMRAAGRALALNPQSSAAATLVGQLMLEPPTRMPPALERQLDATDLEVVRRQGRLSAVTMLAYLAFAPITIWVGVRDWWTFITVLSLIAAMAGTTWWLVRRNLPYIVWAVVGNAAMLVMFSRFFGPFVIVPGIACAATMSFLSFPSLVRRPWFVGGSMVGAIIAPLVLEATGIWERTWEISDGALISRPTALALDGTAAVVFLVGSNVAMIVVCGLFARALAGSRLEAHRKLEIQAWHLGQLLPDAQRPVAQSA